MGWPDALFEGVAFSVPDKLPAQLRLIDDLQIMANMIDQCGAMRMVEMIFSWPRFPGESAVITAPDLNAAIMAQSSAIAARNPPVEIRVLHDGGNAVIAFSLHKALGPFRVLYEQVLFLVFFQIVRSFVGLFPSGLTDLEELVVEQLHAKGLERLLPCRVTSSASGARMIIPGRLLNYANPEFDPLQWKHGAKAEFKPSARRRERAVWDPSVLDSAVSVSLAAHAKVPQLAELARNHALSQRNMARLLAGSGVAYRDIVDRARMALAQELLLQTDLSIAEISRRLDYSEASAFVRSFNRQFGDSPARWRKSRRIAPAALA